MSWIYKGKVFTDEMIPDDAIGFIYRMDTTYEGKSVSYIGRKNFFTDAKAKILKKNLPKDKRKKTYTRVRKMTYQTYYSSNLVLKNLHKEGCPIKREILRICYTKTELSYYETKYQFVNEVLESDEWLNGNILGRFYKQKKHDKQ